MGGFVSLLIVIAFLLTGCGGGDGDNASPAVPSEVASPIVNAGVDLGAVVGMAATLDGSGSYDPQNRPLTFSWELISKPSNSVAVISSNTSPVASIRPDVRGTYLIELKVDNGEKSAADQITLIAQPDLSGFADQASLRAEFDIQKRSAVLFWKDSFPNGTLYAIEGRKGSQPYELINEIEGTGGAEEELRVDIDVDLNTEVRVVARHEGGEATSLTKSGERSLSFPILDIQPSIHLDMEEPLFDYVKLSIENAGDYKQVDYWVDYRGRLGFSPNKPNYAFRWYARSVPAGLHLIQARFEYTPSVLVILERTVKTEFRVFSASISASDYGANIKTINVQASSEYGIKSVTLSERHGRYTKTITDNRLLFSFPIDKTILGEGSYHFLARIIDNADGVVERSLNAVPIKILPEINFTDIEINSEGLLIVRGNFTSARPGARTRVVVRLGASTVILQTTRSPFEATFDMTSRPPTSYTVTATADDDSRITRISQPVSWRGLANR